MPKMQSAVLILLLALPGIGSAQEQGLTPGSIALLFEDATPKASRTPGIEAQTLKAMSGGFLRLGKLSALPQDGVDKASKKLPSRRAFDMSSSDDAAALGGKLHAQAVATASVSVINGIAVLTLRLYDAEVSKKVGEKTSSGPLADLPKQIDSSVELLCSAWAARPKPAAPAAVAKAAPGPAAEPTDLSFLVGYETVLDTSLEIDLSRGSSPFAYGIEIAYGRLDPFANLENLMSVSAIGRWWPQNGSNKKGLYLALSAGFSIDSTDGLLAGPFRLAAGWSLDFGPGKGGLRLDRAIRLQPEIGFTWSSGPHIQDRGIVGFLPFVGLKFRL
jgi:hypothetical protein